MRTLREKVQASSERSMQKDYATFKARFGHYPSGRSKRGLLPSEVEARPEQIQALWEKMKKEGTA